MWYIRATSVGGDLPSSCFQQRCFSSWAVLFFFSVPAIELRGRPPPPRGLVGHFKTHSSVWNGELAAILLSEPASQQAQTSTRQVFSMIHPLVVPTLYQVIFFFSKHKPSSKRNYVPKGGGLCLSVPWTDVWKGKGTWVTFLSHSRQVSFCRQNLLQLVSLLAWNPGKHLYFVI